MNRIKFENRQSAIDHRHAPIRELIQKLYQEANGVPAPWTGRTAKILAMFLASNRGWPVDALLKCVRNRFQSENVNLSEDPIRWINRLPNYVRGPLNRFGEPLKTGARCQVLGARDGNQEYWRHWGDGVNERAEEELRKLSIADGRLKSGSGEL